ncbi:MAG: site-specific integrase [Oscillibacter sp.]|nr:site-specific integrase [Oscillibacter sp.]
MPRKKSMGRAANGNGTIRKKTVTKNGTEYTSWEGRVTVGYDPGTGKQIQKSISGKTQKEVRQKLSKIIVELDEGTYQEPSKMTVGEWLDIWTEEYMGDKKYSTVKIYKAQIETHIKPGLGAVKLSQLVPHMVQKFYNDLLAGGQSVPKRDKAGKIIKKNGKTVYESAPMSAKTVRNVHGVLTKALSTAVSIGYLRMNPAERVTLPRVEKMEIHPLTDEQIKDFLRVSASDDCGMILTVILFAGLRESEAIGLTWDCVDFEKGIVKICKQLQKRRSEDGGMTFAPLKNDKARILEPAPFVMDLLSREWNRQAEQRLRAGTGWKGWQNQEERKTALVFTTADGSYISQTSLRYHFKKIVTQMGVPSCRVHDLRHTFAVLSLQNGDDIKTVQDSLGHATAAFTLDIYGHISERMKDESSARMQAYIDSIYPV